jgi:hypothetical protein
MATDDVVRRFLSEQDLLATLAHPNIARFVDRGCTEDGLPFLVMEFIEGHRIDRYCDEKKLSPKECCELLLRVCEAVAFVHKHGALHRDLSPSNIIVTPEGVPKLVDFGIAKWAPLNPNTDDRSGGTADGAILGTPEYLSPEQAMGRTAEVDVRADVYTLGALLYRLLTGRAPFQGVTLATLLAEIRVSDPVPPRRLKPGIPRPIDTICLKCLQLDARKRYPSADALADDLRRWLDGRPILARPVSIVERGWRWCRRRPVVAALVAALATTALASCGGLNALYRRADAERALAESARAAAEQNLGIATAGIEPLQQLVLNAYSDAGAVGGDHLDEIAEMVRQHTKRVRIIGGLTQENLFILSQIDGRVASRLHESGRLLEARALVMERISLLRECQDRDRDNKEYRLQFACALLQVAKIEREARRFIEALHHLDGAASFVLGTARVDRGPTEQLFALHVSDECRLLGEQLAQTGNPGESNRAKDWQVKILTLLAMQHSIRPDDVMFKACALADNGDWERARVLVQTVNSGRHSLKAVPPLVRSGVCLGISEWLARRMRHWCTGQKNGETIFESFEEEVDSITSFLTDMAIALDIPLTQRRFSIALITSELTTRAAAQRHSARLDDADQTIALLTIFGQRLVQRFPEDLGAYVALSEAYVQRSKNGWKRRDPAGIRRGLAQCIETLNRAQALDPMDREVRTLLVDRTKRLADVPKSL